MQHDSIGADIEAIHGTNLRARRIGAVHASNRNGSLFAYDSLIERYHSSSIDPHGEMMRLFTSDITPVAIDTSLIIAIKFNSLT